MLSTINAYVQAWANKRGSAPSELPCAIYAQSPAGGGFAVAAMFTAPNAGAAIASIETLAAIAGSDKLSAIESGSVKLSGVVGRGASMTGQCFELPVKGGASIYLCVGVDYALAMRKRGSADTQRMLGGAATPHVVYGKFIHTATPVGAELIKRPSGKRCKL